MDVLGPEYGPVEWRLRYDPASELVYTILSQHTSDINSGRAFESLMAEFGTLDAVARGPVERVQQAIRMGGLAKTKAPRIMAVLQMVKREVGSYDLSFLREMPLDEAKAWLKRLPGIGPKTAAIVLCFSMGLPAMPVDTHIYRVSKRLRLIGPKVTAEKGPRTYWSPRSGRRTCFPSTCTSSGTGGLCARRSDPSVGIASWPTSVRRNRRSSGPHSASGGRERCLFRSSEGTPTPLWMPPRGYGAGPVRA